jgi:hypothetical protein
MKKNSFLIIALSLIVFISACKKDQGSNTGSGNFDRSSSAGLEDTRDIPDPTQTVPNVISTNTTLTSDKVWIINGPTFVTNNATLTIQPGTYIKGTKKPTPASKPSFLAITKGSKLEASGTEANPIVFTSNQAASSRTPGDWGGIVLLGNGKTNVASTQAVEGMKPEYMTDLGLSTDVIQYGGSIEADNSGTLKYVRIEFAGDVISDGNELNGLTLGGVGSATTLDHIQVSYGADDAFEFFGGSANAKYLVSYGNNDDDFDFDQGYQGSIQFAVSVKVPCLTYSSSPNGIESNNITSPVVVVDASRLTQPVLSNFTILGQPSAPTAAPFTTSNGALFRVNSAYKVSNSIVAGFVTGANISGATTTGSFFGNSLVHGFTAATAGSPFSVTTSTATSTNTFIRLVNPFNVNICTVTKPIPDFRYVTAPTPSPAATGASFSSISVTHPGGALTAFDTTPVYLGAFGANTAARWDDNWATYTPQTNPYL